MPISNEHRKDLLRQSKENQQREKDLRAYFLENIMTPQNYFPVNQDKTPQLKGVYEEIYDLLVRAQKEENQAIVSHKELNMLRGTLIVNFAENSEKAKYKILTPEDLECNITHQVTKVIQYFYDMAESSHPKSK